MRILVRTIVIAMTLLSTPPILAQSLTGQFLCEAEVGGGIFFDQKSQRWDSNGFTPDGKFVATIKAAEAPVSASAEERLYNYYSVEIAEFGTPPVPCVTGGDFLFGSVKDMDFGTRITCDTLFYTYVINPGALRFLRAYLRGYVDGRDMPGNTPAVMAGKCARLN